MDSLLGGTNGASPSFYEYEYAKADVSSSRVSVSRSPVSSPSAMIETQPAVIPSIFDQICVWFNGIIGRRKIISSALSAGSSVTQFFLLTAVLQASPWAPFASVYGALSLIFSLSAWSGAILVWIASFIAIAFCTAKFSNPDTPRRLCLLRSDAWAVAATYALSQLVLVITAHSVSNTAIQKSDGLFSLLSVLASSGHAIFSLDYRLVFGTFGSKLSLALWECVSVNGDSPLVVSCKEAIRLYRGILAAEVCIGSLLLGPSATLFALLSPSLHISLLLTTVAGIFVARVSIRITREIVMKPMQFVLPPPHAIRSPTPAQTRTLLNVLESKDATLKVFALSDLARLSRMAGERRLEVFLLSQPGGHPRNWTSIKNACIGIIEVAKDKIECATRVLTPCLMAGEGAEDDDDAAAIDRQMLLMPERIRQQVYSSAVRSRHVRSLRAAAAAQPRAPPRPSLLQRVRRFVEVPSGVLSRYDATVVLLAAESLHLLVVASFHEDRYGVVQRDLAEVLRIIIRTANSIREHFRARNARATSSEEDAPLCAVDDALHTAVYQIKNRFGDCLNSLPLTKDEFGAIDLMC